jgi:hypothetical protein
MKRQSFRGALLDCVALILAFGAVGCEPSQQKAGDAVVTRIEEFQRAKGRLPDSLEEIGVEPAGLSCPCYCKTKTGYIVWYGTTLGHSVTYDSQTKKWSDVNGGVCDGPVR